MCILCIILILNAIVVIAPAVATTRQDLHLGASTQITDHFPRRKY